MFPGGAAFTAAYVQSVFVTLNTNPISVKDPPAPGGREPLPLWMGLARTLRVSTACAARSLESGCFHAAPRLRGRPGRWPRVAVLCSFSRLCGVRRVGWCWDGDPGGRVSDRRAPAPKAMTLMEYLIKTGSERVSQQCKENMYAVQTLKDFQYVDRDGKDQGVNVREKAKQLVALLRDEDRLREERAHALKTKEKLAQTATGEAAAPRRSLPAYPPLLLQAPGGLLAGRPMPSRRALSLPLLPGQVGRGSRFRPSPPMTVLPCPVPLTVGPESRELFCSCRNVDQEPPQGPGVPLPAAWALELPAGLPTGPPEGTQCLRPRARDLAGAAEGWRFGTALWGGRACRYESRPAGRSRRAAPPSSAGPLPALGPRALSVPPSRWSSPFPFSASLPSLLPLTPCVSHSQEEVGG